jgi:hypothetical protein
MVRLAVMTDETVDVAGDVDDDRVLVAGDVLTRVLGWTLKPEGLCRDDVCVPVRDRHSLVVDDRVDLVAAAGALGRPTVLDADAGILAIALDHERRAAALQSLLAPDVTLHDLDGTPHSLSQWRGQKRLLHAFSSW